MQGYFAFGSLLLLMCFVFIRAQQLRRIGVKAIHFGEMDKKDFLIPPFVLLFLYLLIANVFDLPRFDSLLFFSGAVAWVGVVLCMTGVGLFIWALVSFGKSFRVGLDENSPDTLVTSGAFSISRNPIYVAFFLVLLGIFLAIPSWVFLIYLVAATWLFNRQIKLEEESLRKVYGDEYRKYCKKVRRYL